MSDTDLYYLPAAEALKRFASGALSPVEYLSALITRAENCEPVINAFTYTHFDEAMEAARGAEARYRNGAPNGILDGLPVAIKDESYIAGKPTSSASLLLKDVVATTTSPINERILGEGGIVHARTATPEHSCAGFTWSKLWGVTRNPWNPEFTPGGSSGGSGAALAAGTAPLATGSDIAGSIRIPASCCGLVGYKPPYGRNPQEPPFNLDTYCHCGPMARTVRDTILLQNVIAGPHPRDITSLRPKLTLPMEFEGVRRWRVAVSMDLGFFEVDVEVEANTRAAVEVLKSLGADVEEVELGWTRDDFDAGVAHLEHIFGAWIGGEFETHGDTMTSYARAFAEQSKESTAADFLRALEAAGRMYESLGAVLEHCKILICPTNALPAVAADFDQSRDKVLINGREVHPMIGWVMTMPFNMLSRCPVLTVPTGYASSGVPTGMQIVGRTYCDADVFRLGLDYETAVGGWFNDASSRPAPV